MQAWLGASADATTKAMRDLARAVVHALSENSTALTLDGGLGAAAARAGLLYTADATLPADASCNGRRRLDAIYEALAATPLDALGFTERTRGVAAECAPTANAVQYAVLRPFVVSVASTDLVELGRAVAAVAAAEKRCATNDMASDHAIGPSATVAELHAVALAGRDRAADARPLLACADLLASAALLPIEPLERLRAAGLGPVPLLTVLSSEHGLGEVVNALARTGALRRHDLVQLIGAISTNALPAVPAPVANGIVRAIGSAVVEDADGGRATVDPSRVVAEIDRTLREPGVRDLLGFGPSPWSFELDAGIPKLDVSELRIAGGLKTGYQARSASIFLQGGVRYFDLTSPFLSTAHTAVTGALDARYITGQAGARIRAELGLSGGLDYVDATTLAQPPGGGRTDFGDYDSLLTKASLTAGLRYRDDRLSLNALVRGGAQLESFDSTSVDARGVLLESPDTLSFQFGARFETRVRVVSDVLSVRAHGELSSFALTRETVAFQSGAPASVTTTSSRQVFTTVQVFLDADVLRFAGFVPAAFGRLDVVALSSASASSSTTVPVIGLGIIRSDL